MELGEWGDRWRDGQIAFHQDAPSNFLDTYADRVWGTARLSRVLVPLCGKSLDMVFLAERADAVVGVEYVEQAVRDFFEERELQPDIDSDAPVGFRAGPYTIFAADFFAVSHADIGPIDAVFDRASLFALDAETRVRYADHVRSLQPGGLRTMLITFDYDQSAMDGPPYAVSDDEVGCLFGDAFDVEHLETRDVLNQRFRDAGLRAMTESAFALTRR
ncbi:thiopurine S-methyltransferase [soil metagenome]